METKSFDWIFTSYDENDNINDVIVVRGRTEHEAEDELSIEANKEDNFDWTLVNLLDEIERFADEHGQTDSELATSLGEDETDPGFSELAIGLDYIWIPKHHVWVAENNALYDKRDDAVIEYIKVENSR